MSNHTLLNDWLPLNSRIAFLLKNQITRGQFLPGQKLPKEDELSVRYGVSRVTIRAALARLEAQKIIVRKRPIGTFVSEEACQIKQNIVSGGVHNIILAAEVLEVKCLGIHRVALNQTRYPNELRDFLECNDNNMEIGWIQRVRSLNDDPIYYIENFMPFALAQNLTLDDLENKPLLRLLKEKEKIKIGKAEMFLEAVPADEDVAHYLKIPFFEPLILAKVNYWWPDGRPLQVVSMYMKPEYFKYRVDLDADGFDNI